MSMMPRSAARMTARILMPHACSIAALVGITANRGVDGTVTTGVGLAARRAAKMPPEASTTKVTASRVRRRRTRGDGPLRAVRGRATAFTVAPPGSGSAMPSAGCRAVSISRSNGAESCGDVGREPVGPVAGTVTDPEVDGRRGRVGLGPTTEVDVEGDRTVLRRREQRPTGTEGTAEPGGEVVLARIVGDVGVADRPLDGNDVAA